MRPPGEPLGGPEEASGSGSVSKSLPRGLPRGGWKRKVWFYLGKTMILKEAPKRPPKGEKAPKRPPKGDLEAKSKVLPR